MIRFQSWQIAILATPIILIVIFLLIAAGIQIHQWRLNGIWGIFILVFVAWRWLLVKWTKPAVSQLETVTQELESQEVLTKVTDNQELETAITNTIGESANDPLIWEDFAVFWQRCQEIITEVAHTYHPEVKRPLLNIYIPQAYGLIRGTVDDTDRWIAKLSPVLDRVTIGQAYETYETYRKLEPSAKRLIKVWNWAQWVLNPAAAIAKTASQNYSDAANRQLIANFNQLLREATLRNLAHQAIALYRGNALPPTFATTTRTLPQGKTQTLKEIFAQIATPETLAQKPVNLLLIGRTGAGKSSCINTLFQQDLAEIDVLPSTDAIQSYQWQTPELGEGLILWDTPGYEQVNKTELRDLVIDYASNADLLLLITPALDPALQMDRDFLQDIKTAIANLPTITIVTQVDRLRPVREWHPPYNWQEGETAKEKAIRGAIEYRNQSLGDYCDLVLPLVTRDAKTQREAWGIEAVSWAIIEAIAPAKQLRLARFLADIEARTVAAAKIIDHYTFQMSTTQGLTALLKSPILQFLSTMTTGNSALASVLAQQIPVEQLPVVIGKLQMAYDLFLLLSDEPKISNFDLRSLWLLLLNNDATPEVNAWAFGHALVEFWTQKLTISELETRYQYYLQQ
ncbi:MAG TPA: GTPase family protein [Xenococcaceae cyanobacterium]